MAVLDMALDMNVVKRKGSWIAYKGETLEQGKEKTAQHLEDHPELMEEIKREVMAKVTEANGLMIGGDTPDEGAGAFPDDPLEESIRELEDGAIAMDLDIPLPED
jgi:recombination protein RecA